MIDGAETDGGNQRDEQHEGMRSETSKQAKHIMHAREEAKMNEISGNK